MSDFDATKRVEKGVISPWIAAHERQDAPKRSDDYVPYPRLLTDEEVRKKYPPIEHGIYCYYGRIGQGKTYAMTADVLEALDRGLVVYTNFPVQWNGYDERDSLFWLFLGLFGKRKFYRFPSQNLRSIEVDDQFVSRFSNLTNCIVALDEAYAVFDSYEMAKLSLSKRKAILHTRHFDRSIWYTTQRPTNIHVVMRGNTNVFYKCERLLKWPFLLFRRTEFDLDSSETVNEEKPYGTKIYFGKKKIFQAYDTKYLRQGTESKLAVIHEHYLSFRQTAGRLFEVGLSALRRPFMGDAKRTDFSVPSTGAKPGGKTKKSVGQVARTTHAGTDNVQELPF